MAVKGFKSTAIRIGIRIHSIIPSLMRKSIFKFGITNTFGNLIIHHHSISRKLILLLLNASIPEYMYFPLYIDVTPPPEMGLQQPTLKLPLYPSHRLS